MQTPFTAYGEVDVGMAHDAGSAIWSYDLRLWGECIQGATPAEALASFQKTHGPTTVQETIQGDEQAFARDHRSASDDELDLTLQILTAQRRRQLHRHPELRCPRLGVLKVQTSISASP